MRPFWNGLNSCVHSPFSIFNSQFGNQSPIDSPSALACCTSSPSGGTVFSLPATSVSGSNAVAFVNYCCAKLAPLRARKAAFTVLTVLLAYLASLFGFGSLIGTLYPLFGYASALFLVLMLLHAVLLFRRKTP